MCPARNKALACELQLRTTMANLISGYHRDLQLTKEPVMRGIEIALACISIMTLVVEALKVNNEKCALALTEEVYATERAYALVKEGVPFRQAYKQVAADLGGKNLAHATWGVQQAQTQHVCGKEKNYPGRKTMELAVILILLAFFLFFIKILGFIFKAGLFVLSIPFQILGAVFGVLLLVLILPFATLVGIVAVVFAPLLVLGPLVPLLLVIGGIYLISKY